MFWAGVARGARTVGEGARAVAVRVREGDASVTLRLQVHGTIHQYTRPSSKPPGVIVRVDFALRVRETDALPRE
jgi:hypothetical protein